MQDIVQHVLTILIICGLVIGAVALLLFTTSRLKWMVVGFLWGAANANFGHRWWMSILAGLVVLALFSWDEHLRAKKVDAVIDAKLRAIKFRPSVEYSGYSELERFAMEVRQAFPDCLSLINGGRPYYGGDLD
jgi:hypothetical protein